MSSAMPGIPFELFAPRLVRRARPLADFDTPTEDKADHLQSPAPAASVETAASIADIADGPREADHPACFVEIRQRIIALAAQACARALHCAVVRNPLFVARFVDEALSKLGEIGDARVVLHPEDAKACALVISADVQVDGSMDRGAVIVSVAGVTIGATLDERAELLVRSADDG